MTVLISKPAINLRAKLVENSAPRKPGLAPRQQYVADGVQTDFTLPSGFKAYAVDSAGLIRAEGIGEEFEQTFDGFTWTVSFAVAPAVGAIVGVWLVGG